MAYLSVMWHALLRLGASSTAALMSCILVNGYIYHMADQSVTSKHKETTCIKMLRDIERLGTYNVHVCLYVNTYAVQVLS